LLLIDVFEDRSAQTFDAQGPKDKNVYMKFEEEILDIICEVNLEYAMQQLPLNMERKYYT